jgi:hypothetical protein
VHVDSLDEVYTRVQKQRKFLLEWLTDEWQSAPDSNDGVAMMIAINELAKEHIVEFDPRWNVRLV